MNGAVPDNAVAIMVPLDAPGHDVAVLVVLPLIPGPAATFALNALTQPRLSVILTTWAPQVTLLKVKGDVPGNIGPASNCQVNGGTPDNAVAVMLPLAAPGQVVAVVMIKPVIPRPAGTFTIIKTVEHPKPISATKIV